MDDIVYEFVSDSEELLLSIENEVLKLHSGNTDINAVFRAVHSIKGSANMLGYNVLGDLCHEAETIMDQVRNNKIQPDQVVQDTFLDVIDSIRQLLGDIETSNSANIDDMVARLKNLGTSSPLEEKPVVVGARQATPRNRDAHARLLVVDDEYLFRKLMKDAILRYYPLADLDFVANGDEALQAFNFSLSNNSPFDLILLDIDMPGKNGFEVLDGIRKAETSANLKETPVVVITGLDGIKNVMSAYKVGCNDYMQKPLNIKMLRHMIDKYTLG